MIYNQITPNVVTTAVSSLEQIDSLEPKHTIVMTCFVLSGSLIFVDCGEILEKAQKFRKDMEEKFQKQTSLLLITHRDGDHYAARDAFKNVDIVTTTSTGEITIKSNKKKEAIKKSIMPNIESKKKENELIIGSKREEIIFREIGGHTADSASIYSPRERTLCTGDNLLSCYMQLIRHSGKQFLDAYHYWENLDIDYVIPGHGHVVKKEFITNVRHYIEDDLLPVIERLKGQGLSINKIRRHPDLPSYSLISRHLWKKGSVRNERFWRFTINELYKIV
ncbi:MAG: MBL fold metallo-hydrolase [Promethearchaeota archaeon]